MPLLSPTRPHTRALTTPRTPADLRTFHAARGQPVARITRTPGGGLHLRFAPLPQVQVVGVLGQGSVGGLLGELGSLTTLAPSEFEGTGEGTQREVVQHNFLEVRRDGDGSEDVLGRVSGEVLVPGIVVKLEEGEVHEYIAFRTRSAHPLRQRRPFVASRPDREITPYGNDEPPHASSGAGARRRGVQREKTVEIPVREGSVSVQTECGSRGGTPVPVQVALYPREGEGTMSLARRGHAFLLSD